MIIQLTIKIPSLSEQEKIGSFFYKLDEKIELQQDKIDKLKDYKKGMMQRIFDQEIRFKDDEGKEYPKWEEKKLGDIISLKNGYAFKSSSYSNSKKALYNIITITNVKGDRYIDTQSSKRIEVLPRNISKHHKLKNKDILISMTGDVGRVSYNKGENNLLNQRVGYLKIKSDKKIDKEFIYQFLSSKDFSNKMIAKEQGAAQKNMKLDYDLISEYERYNLTADEETEMIIVNVYDVKTNTLKRKVELSKLKLMQLIKRYEKTDPHKITWYDRTLLEWGDSDKKKR